MGFNDNKVSISEFNEAAFQIQRLHNLWLDCNKYSRRGDLMKWKWTLDRVWIELSADAKRKKDDIFNEIDKINKKIAQSKTNKINLYDSLQEKEMILRKLQDDVGKGSKRADRFEEIM